MLKGIIRWSHALLYTIY